MVSFGSCTDLSFLSINLSPNHDTTGILTTMIQLVLLVCMLLKFTLPPKVL